MLRIPSILDSNRPRLSHGCGGGSRFNADVSVNCLGRLAGVWNKCMVDPVLSSRPNTQTLTCSRTPCPGKSFPSRSLQNHLEPLSSTEGAHIDWKIEWLVPDMIP